MKTIDSGQLEGCSAVKGVTVPAYLMAQVEIKVPWDEYVARYAKPALQLLESFGAEVMVATPMAQVVEGSWPGNWTVLIRFPSMAVARQFYDAEAYAPLKARRIELCNFGNLVLVETFDPTSLGA